MSEEIKAKIRPLSPHLQVYHLPMAAKMSISHRMTGVILTVGLVLLALWVIAAGLGEDRYNQTMALIDTPYTKYLFVAWAFVLFYHMGNGFRHVLWDIGFGLNEKAACRSGILVLIFAAVMTYGVWSFACGCHSKNHEAAPMTKEVQARQEAE